MAKGKTILFIFGALFLGVACAPVGVGSPAACDSAVFIDHVIVDTPVELGTVVMPGTHFTKTWRLQNDGDCSWTADYTLQQVGAQKWVLLKSILWQLKSRQAKLWTCLSPSLPPK